MNAIGLHLVNSTEPTHFTSTSSTLLDLCFVNNNQRVLLFDQLSASMFSKHDLLFLSYEYNAVSGETCKTVQFRNFNNINSQSL